MESFEYKKYKFTKLSNLYALIREPIAYYSCHHNSLNVIILGIFLVLP